MYSLGTQRTLNHKTINDSSITWLVALWPIKKWWLCNLFRWVAHSKVKVIRWTWMRVTIGQDSWEKCTCFLLGDSGFPLKSISLILTPILNLTSPSKLHFQPKPKPKPKPTTQQTGQLLHRLVAMTLDWMLLSCPHYATCAAHFIVFLFFCLAVGQQKLSYSSVHNSQITPAFPFVLTNQKHNTTQSGNIHRKCFIHTEHPELSTLSTFQTSTVYHVCCLCCLGHRHSAKNTYAFLFNLLYERDLFN